MRKAKRLRQKSASPPLFVANQCPLSQQNGEKGKRNLLVWKIHLYLCAGFKKEQMANDDSWMTRRIFMQIVLKSVPKSPPKCTFRVF